MKKVLFLVALYPLLTYAQVNDSSFITESKPKQLKPAPNPQQSGAVSNSEKILREGRKAFGFQPTTVQGIGLYGRVNVFLTKKADMSTILVGDDQGEGSMIGIKGWEDLGKGYAALFMLEGGFKADTGGGASLNDAFAFNRSAFVGLVTPYGLFRVGRSGSPFGTYIFGNGQHVGIGRGVGIITGSLPGAGIDPEHQEMSAVFNNGFYWDGAINKLQFGAAITTAGDQFEGKTNRPELPPVDNEGQSKTKPAYGSYMIYRDQIGPVKYSLGGAFQVQNGTYYPTSSKPKFANGEAKRGWLTSFTADLAPFKFNLAHNRNLFDNKDVPNTGFVFPSDPMRDGHSTSTAMSLGWQINPADYTYLTAGIYRRKHSLEFFPASNNIVSALTNKGEAITGAQKIQGWQVSLGYEHRLSKRTVLYTDVRQTKVKQSCTLNPISNNYQLINSLACQNAADTIKNKTVGHVGYGYDIGISHSF